MPARMKALRRWGTWVIAAVAVAALSGCYECTQQNCADGCCSEDGVCIVAASEDSECGTGGFACVDCRLQPGTTCLAGQCVPRCTQQNCASGCCTTNGDCQHFGVQTTFQCGRLGEACRSCATTACQSGLCCVGYDDACVTASDCCPGSTCVQLSTRRACR